MAAKDCLGPQCDAYTGGLFAGTQLDLFGGEGTPVFSASKYNQAYGPDRPPATQQETGTKGKTETNFYEHSSHSRVGTLGEEVTHEVGKLYHGGGGEVLGGVLKPGENNLYGRGAYAATGTRSGTYHYAQEKAKEQGRLFGSIREVTPESRATVVADPDLEGQEYNPQMAETGKDIWVKDKVGLRAGREIAFPTNPDVLRGSEMGRQIYDAYDEDYR